MKLHIPDPVDVRYADKLFDAARKVRTRAYAPYSNFLVGAAILTVDGRTYVGSNVECADYDGTHAEESALSAMVAGGELVPERIAIYGGLKTDLVPFNVPPCGKCRQKLMEFSGLSGRDLRILVIDPKEGLRVLLLSELLPWSFGPQCITSDETSASTKRDGSK